MVWPSHELELTQLTLLTGAALEKELMEVRKLGVCLSQTQGRGQIHHPYVIIQKPHQTVP